jgi:hypothetical protein
MPFKKNIILQTELLSNKSSQYQLLGTDYQKTPFLCSSTVASVIVAATA